MIEILKMAFRDLARNRRRSFFSALALGMGLALLLLMAAVVDGETRHSMELSIRLQTGHLQVSSTTYAEGRASLKWEDLVENPNAAAAQIAALPPVRAATPRVIAGGILASGDKTYGVRAIGLDVASEASAPYRNGLLSGTYLAADDRDGLMVGQALADKAGIKSGDRVNLLVNTSNGDLAEQTFLVRGVFSTKTPAYDQTTIILPIAKAQAITGAGDHASILFILLDDRERAPDVAAAIQAGRLQVSTWREMNALLVEVGQLSDAFMIVLYLIVLAITATVIVNTLVMAVFERTREIGILSAIGMKSSRIMAMFFAESALLAVGGIVIGLLLGGLLVAYGTHFGFYIGNYGITGMLLEEYIYANLTVRDTVTLTIVAFVITLVASLYPATLAARMEPVEALRSAQ